MALTLDKTQPQGPKIQLDTNSVYAFCSIIINYLSGVRPFYSSTVVPIVISDSTNYCQLSSWPILCLWLGVQ
jgi:hypothetical protein